MGQNEFIPFGNGSLTVEFNCDQCDNCVKSEEIAIPTPNLSAEKASDSYNENSDLAYCDNCQKEFDVYVYAGYADGYVEVRDIDSVIVHEIEDDGLSEYYEDQIEAILNSSYYEFYFTDEIEKLKALNSTDLANDELQVTLSRQLFSGAITCLEDYLSTTLIQNVLNNDDTFRRFVQTFKGIKGRKFTLSEIYDKLDTIRAVVEKELVDVIYHDLPKVKGMYQDTLEIDVPDISELMKAIKIRHDMVHRNGKNKKGETTPITRELVIDVIDKVQQFVESIDQRIAATQS